MIVTTPRMGTITMLLEDLFKRLGVEYLPPPPTTDRTLALGVRHSPEMACLPLKLTIGNLIEGLEAGADTTLMVGGVGPCRFGYYADLERRIIGNLGYEFESITLEPPSIDWKGFTRTVKRFAPDLSYRRIWKALKTSFRKGQALDRVDRRSLHVRCYETRRGDTTRARKEGHEIIREAWTWEEIEEAEACALALFDTVPLDRDREILKMGFLGEFYLLLEPFTNFDIDEYLGERRVFLERGLYLSDWIGPSSKNPVGGVSDEETAEAAAPYITHYVGAEGRAVVGHSVLLKREGFDGIVHLMPFTCMPEIIAKSVMPLVSRDKDLPYLALVIDEQTGRTGIYTRLEAFLDLLWSRRHRAAGRVPVAAGSETR